MDRPGKVRNSKENTPEFRTPLWVDRILRRICPVHLYECIAGDLLETFVEESSALGTKKAKRNYVWNALKFLHPEIFLRKKFNQLGMNRSLIISHIKISFRNLRKGRSYSLINILGLSLGLAVFLLLMVYTKMESDYDQFYADSDRIYRVNQSAIWEPGGYLMGSTAPPLAQRLIEDYPEVEEVLRINTPGPRMVRYQGAGNQLHAYQESHILAADSSFFSFFDLELAEGDYRDALSGSGKVVISKEMAEKYFGSDSALGKVLELGDDRAPIQVTAVTKNQPRNMHFHFDFLISMETNPNVKKFDWSWIWTQMVTYVKLNPGMQPEVLEDKMREIPEKYIQSTFNRMGMNYEEFVADKGDWIFTLQPVGDIHLKSVNIGNRIGPISDIATIRSLLVLAYLILSIAIINFINLSTARSSTRAREIGVKKTLGAFRRTIVGQFLTESMVITVISTFISIPLLKLLAMFVFQTAGVAIAIEQIFTRNYLMLLILTPVLVGLLAGAYPSIHLSRFDPVRVLKGKLAAGMKHSILRNGLVTFQFAVSVALLSGSFIIFQQVHFMMNKNLGFNQENLLVINHAEQLGNQISSFREEMNALPRITNATVSMEVPGRGRWEDIYMREGSEIKLPISQIKIDDHFFSTFDLDILTGREFLKDNTADYHNVIINETTARMFNWTPEQSLGEQILYPGYSHVIRVVGVVRDFHFQSLKENITPLMFFNEKSDMWGNQRVVTLKYTTDDMQSLLASIEDKWSQLADDAPFEYSFYDEELDQLYDQEKSLGGLIGIFTGLSLFIAVIGLIGLVSFATVQKRKEIGIRKVMGASVPEIIFMINKPYLKLFIVALLIATPIAWNFLRQWLNKFAFRIDIDPWVFGAAGFIMIGIAVISAGFLIYRAAIENPAVVLQEE